MNRRIMAISSSSGSASAFTYTGVLSGIPATCTVGQIAFITDATAGQNIYECASTNVWTQQTGGGGGSVAVDGTTVTSPNLSVGAFDKYAGNRFGAFGSNITVQRAFPQNSNLYIFGDSTATLTTQSGDSAAPAGLLGRAGYAGQLITNTSNGVAQDWAVSGDQWEDVSIRVWAHISDWWLASNATGQLQSTTVLMTPGINNANFKGTNTYLTTITRPSIYASMAGAMLTASNFTFGQAAGCVKTGTWTTDNTTFTNASSPADVVSGIAEVSNTNGDTIACPITTTSNSPVGIVVYGMKDSNSGTFTLSSSAGACTDVVTGLTTLNAFGGSAISTNNGATITIGAALCPLVSGAYTMTATITSATNASNKVWILGMGALPAFPGHRSTVAPMVLGGVLRARTDTNSTWTNNYDQESMNAAARLSQTYNYPVQFVPLHTYTVATLPAAPITGALADVNDSASATACTSGSGTNVVRCRYNGATWDAQIGGVPPINLPTASGFYTDGLHPARALHSLIYEQIAPFFPSRVSNSTSGLCFSPDNAQSIAIGAGAPVECFTAIGGGTPALALGDGTTQGGSNGTLTLKTGGTVESSIWNTYTSDGLTINFQQGGQNKFLLGCATCRFGLTSGGGTSSEDTTFDRLAAGTWGVSTSTPGNHDGMISAKGFLSPNKTHLTAQTATKTIYTLCAAATGGCNVAGQYRVAWYFNQGGTACGTPGTGGVTFALTWVDNAGTHSAVALPMDDASSLTATGTKFTAQASNTAAWASGVFNIWSTGASDIQVTNTYTACGVGTLTWELAATVERVQ